MVEIKTDDINSISVAYVGGKASSIRERGEARGLAFREVQWQNVPSVTSMNREVMNRSGHQHGRGEAILGIGPVLLSEKYITEGYLHLPWPLQCLPIFSVTCGLGEMAIQYVPTSTTSVSSRIKVSRQIQKSYLRFEPITVFTVVPWKSSRSPETTPSRLDASPACFPIYSFTSDPFI